MDKSNGRKRPRTTNNGSSNEGMNISNSSSNPLRQQQAVLSSSSFSSSTSSSSTKNKNIHNTVYEQDDHTPITLSSSSSSSSSSSVKDRLIKLLENRKEGYVQKEIETQLSISTNTLLPVLQELLNEKRLQPYTTTSKLNGQQEILYRIVSAETAALLSDLSPEDHLVLQAIEKSGNTGIWVRTLKLQTRLQQAHVNKILKRLENKKLIKPIKSIIHKARRMYMLYGLEPAKQLTGGPWYSDQELDEEFIEGLRNASITILDRHGGGPLTANQVLEEIIASKITPHPLTVIDIQHILDMLVYDNRLDYESGAIHRLKLNANYGRAFYPYGGASIRLAYDPVRDSTIGTLSGIGDDKGITISAGKRHVTNYDTVNNNGFSTDGGYGVHNDEDDEEDDEDMASSKGLAMTLRVGGSAESRIGMGLGFARRTAHTAALMANKLVQTNQKSKHDNDEDYEPSEEEEDDEDEDEEEEDDGFRRRSSGKSKTKTKAKSTRTNSKATTRFVDDDDEDDDEDDYDDDDDDEEEDEGPRYVLLKRVVGGPNDGSHVDHFTLNPCGVCPVFDQCTPGGIISPETCIYFTNWLEF